MTEQEKISARRHLKLQRELENPVLKKAYELGRNKLKEETRRMEVLSIWNKYDRYVSPEDENKLIKAQSQETAQQEKMKNALKNFM